MCKCIYACKDQMGYLLDMKKTKIAYSTHFQKKKSSFGMFMSALECSSSFGVSKQPQTLPYFVGLVLPKATAGCPGDNHGVCCLMGK